MSFRYHYLTPQDMFQKMEREASRMLCSASDLQKDDMCDHFFNFCVTAHSLRDWVIAAKQMSFKEANALHDLCSSVAVLKACKDIANSSKHFRLDDRKASKPIARSGVISHAEYVDVYEDKLGGLHLGDPKMSMEINLVIDGLPIYESRRFARLVMVAWKELLTLYELPCSSIFDNQTL